MNNITQQLKALSMYEWLLITAGMLLGAWLNSPLIQDIIAYHQHGVQIDVSYTLLLISLHLAVPLLLAIDLFFFSEQ
ncbi:hypothetical protein L3Q72_17195 [Vibrio sp. JC009]|uniref:hypothetical protein n=1 Tax=Vibrio sp. JC009 TaxID=2912314 RepID=UPI0023B189D1|nr:hypothetical protein [Vibrio sp. JC009]WED24611.1 hypothetical protein L3Q72_17195 [Vibrio sp. JC009]